MRKATIFSALHCTGLAAGVFLAGACQYDTDKLYRFATDASAAGGGGDGGIVASEPPADLISWFASTRALSDECISCATDKCNDANTSCKGDDTCVAFTACIAEEDTPAQREDCREQYRDWLGDPDKLFARDTTGPYAACVFQQRCDVACGTRTDLDCLGAYSWPTSSEVELSYRLRISDTNSRPVAGASVRVCDANDSATCSDRTTYTSDSAGIVDLRLPVSATGAFVGYLEITGDDLQGTLVRFGWPVARSGVTNLTVIPALLYYTLSMLDGSVGVDDTRGMLQMRAIGCSGWPVRGIRYSVDGQDTDPLIASWYTASGAGEILPDFTAPGTDDLGAGGVINVPPGRAQAKATRISDGATMASLTVPVRANNITIVVLSPLAAR